MIIREEYLSKIRPFINKKIIKIITGVRRSGKSVIFTQIIDELLNDGVSQDQIIYIKLDLYENEKFKDKNLLFNYINERSLSQNKIYLFLDEIQEVKGFELLINSFMDRDFDIYLTGSNSSMLSSELATYLTGRYVSFEVYPFSFSEFVLFNQNKNIDNLFLDYISYGGLPQLQYFENTDSKMMLLKDLFNSIIIKDLVERFSIRNVNQFERYIIYLIGIVSRNFSSKNVVNFFNSEGRTISKESLYNYLNYARDAFIIYSAERYDIQGKKTLETNEKIFINDQGFRSLFYNNKSDIEKVLENIVYFELRRRGFEVFVGYEGEYEVDFVAIKGSYKEYYHVCYLLSSPKVSEREFRTLLNIKDQFPKFVLSLDKINMSYEGVIHKNIIDYLLEKNTSK